MMLEAPPWASTSIMKADIRELRVTLTCIALGVVMLREDFDREWERYYQMAHSYRQEYFHFI